MPELLQAIVDNVTSCEGCSDQKQLLQLKETEI